MVPSQAVRLDFYAVLTGHHGAARADRQCIGASITDILVFGAKQPKGTNAMELLRRGKPLFID